MQKWVTVTLTATMLMALAGCGKAGSQSASSSSTKQSASVKKKVVHKKTKAAKKSSSSSATSSQSSQASQSSASTVTSSSASQASQATASSQAAASSASAAPAANDTATHTGVPAALLGKYQETEKSEAAGFASFYEFTPTNVTYGASGMPAVVLDNVSYQIVNGNYVISGTGEPAGIYKGGPEKWTIIQQGNQIRRADSSVWAVKQ